MVTPSNQGQQQNFSPTQNAGTPRNMSRAEINFRDEVKNMLILLEHYKLQLTVVLPKVCFVMRKAQLKGSKKIADT